MNIETSTISAELLNTAFVDKVCGGLEKEAAEAGSRYIRQKLYEDGILRRLFPPRTVTAEELDKDTDSDIPSIISEIEPDASKATYVPFKGTGEHRYFEGKSFRIYFGKVESERVSKNKFELLTYKMPITQWLQENHVKAVQQEEDGLFIQTLGDILTVDASQKITVSAGATDFKQTFIAGMKALTSRRLPQGKVLMHKNTFIDSLALKTEDIGYKPQEERFNRGVDGEDSFLGVPVVTTIKDDLVKENEMYFFAPQEYFMHNYLLQDATLFLETRADMIHFHTYEAPGCGIGNTGAFVKIVIE